MEFTANTTAATTVTAAAATPTVGAVHLGKACISCIRSKRRCDKKLPSCHRCTQKDIICRYPSERPYSRHPARAQRGSWDTYGESFCQADDPLIFGLGGGGDGREYTSSNESCVPGPFEPGLMDLGAPIEVQGLWYRREDSWGIHYGNSADVEPGIRLTDLKDYKNTIRGWLQQWVGEGHCPFIHRELYADTGLPQCLQDAFASLAAYSTKNEKNEAMVMQLVEDKANSLLRAAHADGQDLRITQRIARVQALFVYQFIRLFDGDIRQRAQSEKSIPVLAGWANQLLESARLEATMRCLDSSRSQPLPAVEWRDWIRAESVRRTWMVALYTQAIYTTLRDGVGACPGSIAYTLRRGLWDASSDVSWAEIVSTQGPLFMRTDSPSKVLATVLASEVDAFALGMMAIM